MEPLKNIYNLQFITKLEDVITLNYPAFERKRSAPSCLRLIGRS